MEALGLSIIVPFFGIMVAGYFIGFFRVLPDNSSEVLSRFVFSVSLPALIFVSISRVPVADFFNWPFLGTLGGGMLIMLLIGLVVARVFFSRDLTANALHGMASMYSSTAYIGLPLVLTVFGDAALAPGVIGAVITGAVFSPMVIVLAEFGRGKVEKRKLWAPLLAALNRPPIIATASGLLVSAMDITLPQTVVTFCETLGGAFVPCALFAAGLFVARCTVRGLGVEIGWLVFAKLLMHPLITWWLAYEVFALEGILPMVAVIQAALPCGVPVFVLAQQYGIFVTQSSATIAWSTALSVVTLSVVFLLLGI